MDNLISENENFDLKPIGRFIRFLREQDGLSLDELAKDLGVTKSAVCQWESGECLQTKRLIDIADYFDLPLSNLLACRLRNETSDSFCDRQYGLDDGFDLSDYDGDNRGELLAYLDKWAYAKRRMMHLIVNYRYGDIDDDEKEELDYLLKRFKPNKQYLSLAHNTDDWKEAVNKLLTTDDTPFDVSVFYELEMIFRSDLDASDVLVDMFDNCDEEICESLCGCITENKRCEVLTSIVEMHQDNHELLENHVGIKELYASGASCLYGHRDLVSIRTNMHYPDTVEGNVREDADLRRARDNWSLLDKKTTENRIYMKSIYSYMNYETFMSSIDHVKDHWINALVFLKKDDPVKYVNHLLCFESDCFEPYW